MTTPDLPVPRVAEGGRMIQASVEIAAPPEHVFAALIDPEQLAHWWGGIDATGVPVARDWRVDARPGGRWSARATAPDGRAGLLRGEYLAFEPGRRLEFTWRASWDGFATTVVRYELVPISVNGIAGTRITVTHTAVAALRGTFTMLARAA